MRTATQLAHPEGELVADDGDHRTDGGASQRHPLVLVEWHDAWFDFDLPDAGGRRADYLVRTVGFLVAEDPRFLSLAQEVLPEGEGFRAVTHIPVAIVERVSPLAPRPSAPV
jgi:hypothetical protein